MKKNKKEKNKDKGEPPKVFSASSRRPAPFFAVSIYYLPNWFILPPLSQMLCQLICHKEPFRTILQLPLKYFEAT